MHRPTYRLIIYSLLTYNTNNNNNNNNKSINMAPKISRLDTETLARSDHIMQLAQQQFDGNIVTLLWYIGLCHIAHSTIAHCNHHH